MLFTNCCFLCSHVSLAFFVSPQPCILCARVIGWPELLDLLPFPSRTANKRYAPPPPLAAARVHTKPVLS